MELQGKYGKAIVYTDDIEQEAISQIINLLNQPMAHDANVRIMPDVHAGAGCVIGYTAKFTDKVIPNLIGVDIGCFSGDTKIALTDGRNLTFEELVNEYEEGKENYCYSLDKDSNIVIGKIENPHQTKISDTIFNIELDNGETIKCTPEHIFFTRDNKEIMAKDLFVGMSLMPLYLEIAKDVPFEEKSYQNKKNKLEEYKVVYNPNTQKYDYVHFLADDYNMILELDNKENGGIRHHKDFDKLNNNPSNIQRVGWKERWKIHQEAVVENNKKGITGFGKACKNHKVVSITIENIQIPVYDLQVPEYNNYALASGVFVHNCGVTAWKLGKRSVVGEKFDKLDKVIRTQIPNGKEVREEVVNQMILIKLFDFLNIKESYVDWSNSVDNICKKIQTDKTRVWQSIGSLGGGNHFIEIDKDDNDELWLVIHSGSRNFGLKIAKYHQKKAEETLFSISPQEFDNKVQEIKRTKKGKGIEVAIQALRKEYSKKGKSTGLEFLEGGAAKDYYDDMHVAQIYAQLSRRVMGYYILKKMYKIDYFTPVESVHNYINFDDGIIRKGAISAHKGEEVIIPLNMKRGCVIGIGLGNSDYNYSALHGAGRKMSRSTAKKNISLDKYQRDMKDVWSSCVNKNTIDESPATYKDADKVIEFMKDTVEVTNTLKSVYNFKSGE